MATRKEIQDVAHSRYSTEQIANILDELYAIAMDKNNITKDRLTAINSILDRFVGKATEELVITSKVDTTTALLAKYEKSRKSRNENKRGIVSQEIDTARLLEEEQNMREKQQTEETIEEE